MKHDWINPCTRTDDAHNAGCMWCDGGLEMCDKCSAFEGATPDECPGKHMTHTFSTAVYEGRLNYRDGYWRFECAEVMRPVYDLENYMKEHGYIQDGLNLAGNLKWKKVDESGK